MHVKAISVSDKKGMRKKNISSARLIKNFGIEGDAHGGKWHRQISFLAEESIASMRDKGLDVAAGNFAENLTTEGIDLTTLEVGSHLQVGGSEIIISQLGKICHTRCAIFYLAGDCVMPREGIFGVVATGGMIEVGDQIHILGRRSGSAAVIGAGESIEKYREELSTRIESCFSPAFIRFDALSNKEGGGPAQILEDLTKTQQTDNIIVFDPAGSIGLSLPEIAAAGAGKKLLKMNRSSVYYCRGLSGLDRIGLPG